MTRLAVLCVLGAAAASLTVAVRADARFAPLEEATVQPACLIVQTHPPLHIPLCGTSKKSLSLPPGPISPNPYPVSPCQALWQSPGECFYGGEDPPRAGQIFIAYVLVRSEEARARYESIQTQCSGAIFNKRGTRQLGRVAEDLTSLPEGAAVPAVQILVFKIPNRIGRPAVATAGKRFGYACSGSAVQLMPDGTKVFTHGDGGFDPRWTILP